MTCLYPLLWLKADNYSLHVPSEGYTKLQVPHTIVYKPTRLGHVRPHAWYFTSAASRDVKCKDRNRMHAERILRTIAPRARPTRKPKAKNNLASLLMGSVRPKAKPLGEPSPIVARWICKNARTGRVTVHFLDRHALEGLVRRYDRQSAARVRRGEQGVASPGGEGSTARSSSRATARSSARSTWSLASTPDPTPRAEGVSLKGSVFDVSVGILQQFVSTGEANNEGLSSRPLLSFS